MSMVLRPPGDSGEKLRLAKHIRLITEERGGGGSMEDAGREREAAYLVSVNRGGLSPSNGLSGQQYPLEQEMALHSSILGWKIPWAKEPDGLQSMGLQRVGHN